MKLKNLYERYGGLALAIMSGVGFVATTIMVAKDTLKYKEKLDEGPVDLTTEEKIKLAIPTYKKSLLVGSATLSCIVGASVKNYKDKGMVVGAYTLAERAISKYATAIPDNAESRPPIKMEDETFTFEDIDLMDEDERLFYDSYSGRYFTSTLSNVLDAQYYANRELVIQGSVPLSMYYKWVGLDTTNVPDEIAWIKSPELPWIEFENVVSLADDGLECYVVMWAPDSTVNRVDLA